MAVNGMLADVLYIFRIQVGSGGCSAIPWVDPVAFAGVAVEYFYNMSHAAVFREPGIPGLFDVLRSRDSIVPVTSQVSAIPVRCSGIPDAPPSA